MSEKKDEMFAKINKSGIIMSMIWLFASIACQNHKDTKETIKTEKIIKIKKTNGWEVNDFFSLSKNCSTF